MPEESEQKGNETVRAMYMAEDQGTAQSAPKISVTTSTGKPPEVPPPVIERHMPKDCPTASEGDKGKGIPSCPNCLGWVPPEPCRACGQDTKKKGGMGSPGAMLCLECDSAGRLFAARAAHEYKKVEAERAKQFEAAQAQPAQKGKEPRKPEFEEHECLECRKPIRIGNTPEAMLKLPEPDVMFTLRAPGGGFKYFHLDCYLLRKQRLRMRDKPVKRAGKRRA